MAIIIEMKIFTPSKCQFAKISKNLDILPSRRGDGSEKIFTVTINFAFTKPQGEGTMVALVRQRFVRIRSEKIFSRLKNKK